MAQRGDARTRAQDVYRSVKDDIRAGRLAPGDRLNLGEMAKGYGVSLTVVREAVTRLSAEYLVQATPQRGYRVTPLSEAELLDLTRVRIEIERLTIGESVTLGGLDWETRLVAAHHRLKSVAPASGTSERGAGVNPQWVQAHSDFHEALSAACTSPLLKGIRQELFEGAELYRHWTRALIPADARDVIRRTLDEDHAALLEAALAHDAGRAVDLAVPHIQRTTDLLLEYRRDESGGNR
ncbi:GntR family transcriptional regulator [Actinomadura roseirufa]|uniref:GntR family transcriptional regulator n=1 Tax=Actinomadura roseirufa TaxID=2094049 RepID=UPI0010415B4F|nr:GntR family transcriptional regulator [Actinomadura roseirufa]